MKFTNKPPRRRSYLYMQAEAVLRDLGTSTSAKVVADELEKRRVIYTKAKRNGELLLTWRDAAGRRSGPNSSSSRARQRHPQNLSR
jgi:hypothetical protein